MTKCIIHTGYESVRMTNAKVVLFTLMNKEKGILPSLINIEVALSYLRFFRSLKN